MGKKILKIGLRVLDGAVTALLVALLACQGYVLFARTVLKKPNPTVFGFHSAVVLTGSMADAIQPEDFIVTRRQKSYSVGDIVTYTAGDTTVTPASSKKPPPASSRRAMPTTPRTEKSPPSVSSVGSFGFSPAAARLCGFCKARWAGCVRRWGLGRWCFCPPGGREKSEWNEKRREDARWRKREKKADCR